LSHHQEVNGMPIEELTIIENYPTKLSSWVLSPFILCPRS
jgi:hypothetical protein